MSTAAARQTYPFSLPDLPYGYDALEPHVDQTTLQVHHREHHQGYVTKLNDALAQHADLHAHTLQRLLAGTDKLPAPIQDAVRHNGGGHLNHDFFWSSLTPAHAALPSGPPAGALAEALIAQFGSFDAFREKFSAAAVKHFASGWVALAFDHSSAKLEITALDNHEVLPDRKTGLLIIDVWEHAYYLKYQNRRPEFVTAFWNIVNWSHAEELFARATAST